MPLSVIIIMHNAGRPFGGCLASAAFADEIVVVDSDGTDGKVELARRLDTDGRVSEVLREGVYGFPRCNSFLGRWLRLGFLDGVPGLVHVCIGCMNSFTKYARLISLRRPPPE